MWNLEKDPHLSASIANVTILDTLPDAERLRSRLEHRRDARPPPAPAGGAGPRSPGPAGVAGRPRVRPRLPPPLGGPPCARHDAPAARSDRTIVNRPFDRTRPLWEFVIVEGLEGGRAAMVQKLHHAITDGEGGIRMSEQFIDLSRDATEPIAVGGRPPRAIETSLVDTTVETLTHNLRRGLGIARRAAEGAVSPGHPPHRALAAGADAAELARSAVRQLVVTDQAHSPLWTERSLRRHLEVLQVPFDDAKTAAKALGGSLNDLFVTAAAGGAGAVHRAAGPARRRAAHHDAGEHPQGRLGGWERLHPHPGARARWHRGPGGPVRRRAGVPGPDQGRAGARRRSTGWPVCANLLPTSLAVRLARQQVETVDFAISNVRGAPFPLFIAGARMEANYPSGPRAERRGTSRSCRYDGHLDMGLNADAGAVEDPGALCATPSKPSSTPSSRRGGRHPAPGGAGRRARPRPAPRRADAEAISAAVSSMRTSRSRSETSSVETSSRCMRSDSPVSMRRRASSITPRGLWLSASPASVMTSSVSVIASSDTPGM